MDLREAVPDDAVTKRAVLCENQGRAVEDGVELNLPQKSRDCCVAHASSGMPVRLGCLFGDRLLPSS